MSDERPSTFRFEIAIDQASEHNFWAGLAMDGAEGVFVATYRPLQLGACLELDLMLPGETEPLVVRGIVRWTRCHREGSDGAAGVGLKFEDPSDVLRAKSARFAKTVREPILFELDEPPMRQRRRSSGSSDDSYSDRAAE